MTIPLYYSTSPEESNAEREMPGHRSQHPGGQANGLFRKTSEREKKRIIPQGQMEELHDFTRKLFQWRKGKEVIHNGKTMHFLSRDNTYGYFRYNDTDAVFVYINNSRGKKHIPWSHYAEIADGLHDGRNVITGESVTVSDSTVVGPRQVLVVEYKR